MVLEFNLGDRIIDTKGEFASFYKHLDIEDVKEFIKKNEEPLNFDDICIGFKLSDAVKNAITFAYNNRLRKFAGDKLNGGVK